MPERRGRTGSLPLPRVDFPTLLPTSTGRKREMGFFFGTFKITSKRTIKNYDSVKPSATPFLFSYFCVVLGCGQRYFFSVYGDDLGETLVNLEWATNTQNALCFTAVVCALEVLYNQRAKASSAE